MAHYNLRMRRFVMRSTLLIFLVLFLLSSVSNSKAEEDVKPRLAGSPYDLINAVNALRASYGLAPYSINPTLMAVAQAHADYMAATGNVSHTGAGGSSVTERLLAAGYPLAGDLSLGGFRSENITSGNEAKSAQDAVNGWTGDAPHLTTMISASLTEIGAGVSINGGRVYYVIDCAAPTNGGLPQPVAGTSIAGAPTVLPAGGVIIPVIVVTPNVDGDVIHEVRAGQTLWQIAISYETKIDEIKRLNNIYDNNIYPGEKLLIKEGASVPTTTPVETAVMEAAASPTTPATVTTVFETPAATAVASATPIAASTNTVMSIAIGIITLALLGGVFFVRFGDVKENRSKTKE